MDALQNFRVKYPNVSILIMLRYLCAYNSFVEYVIYLLVDAWF